jgi:hypothetical protein
LELKWETGGNSVSPYNHSLLLLCDFYKRFVGLTEGIAEKSTGAKKFIALSFWPKLPTILGLDLHQKTDQGIHLSGINFAMLVLQTLLDGSRSTFPTI